MFFYEKVKVRTLIFVTALIAVFVGLALTLIEVKERILFDSNLFQLLLYVGILLWFFWIFKNNKSSLSDFTEDIPKIIEWKEIILIVLFHAIITISSILGIVYVLSFYNPGAISEVLNNQGGTIPLSLTSKVLFSITAVILAPVVEELMFRGVIFNRIRLKYGIGSAIIISSLFFGILHFKLAIIGAFTFGICLSLLYLRTRNIVIPMVAHFLNNFLVSLILFFVGGASAGVEATYTIEGIRTTSLLIGLPFSIASIIFLVYYIKKNWPKGGEFKALTLSNKEKGTALVIIDVQEGLFTIPEEPIYNSEALIGNIIKLIDKARSERVQIIYVQHGNNSSGILEFGTYNWQIHHAIMPSKGDIIVHKKAPDSFYKTTLQNELDMKNIGKLIITGLQTEYCIDTTCRRSASLGYKVILVEDGHSTCDTDILEANQIIRHHNRILGGAFGEVKATEELLVNSLQIK